MRAAAILIFDKCLYLRGRLRLTPARRLSAYMSSRALATTTASIVIHKIIFHKNISGHKLASHFVWVSTSNDCRHIGQYGNWIGS